MFSKASRGMTLIEVLIAVLVLSVGLLGALKLQNEGLRLNTDSKYTVVASALAQDALDTLSYDRFGDRSNWVSMNAAAGVACDSGASSVAGSATRAAQWAQRVSCNLPDGRAEISCATSSGSTISACEVVLKWTPPGREQISASYKTFDAASSAASSSGS